MDAGRRIGAVLRIGPRPDGDARAESRPLGSPRPVHGWASLSDSERSVAGLVAEGLTNREAAARLVLSPLTIDFYLRHIFGKGDVSSRVELTRVVMAYQGLMPDRQ
jgi:DNA-binding CsgD family transcriptional regulator